MGRAIAKIFAVLALGAGTGTLTWGVILASTDATMRVPPDLQCILSTPSEAIGFGAGFLAAGVTSLVLSFIGGSRRTKASAEE